MTNDWFTSLEHLGQAIPAALLTLTAWTTALLVAATLLDRLTGNRLSAHQRLLLYVPVFARFFVGPEWSTALGIWPAQNMERSWTTAASFTSAGSAVPFASENSAVWGTVLLVVYLAIATAVAWVWIAQARHVRTIRREATLSQTMTGVAVHASAGPMAIGLRNPIIVLPAGLLQMLKPDQIDLILRHERAHIAARHGVYLLVIQLSLIVAWPLVPMWIAAHRMRQLLEHAADGLALRDASSQTRQAYGELLIRLDSPTRGVGLASFLVLGFGSDLASRIRALPRRKTWPSWLQTVVALLFVTLALACAGKQHSQDAAAVPAKTTEQSVLLKLEILIDGEVVARPRLVTRPGEMATLQTGSDDGKMLTINATPQVANDVISLQLEVESTLRDSPLHEEVRLVLRSGESGSIEKTDFVLRVNATLQN